MDLYLYIYVGRFLKFLSLKICTHPRFRSYVVILCRLERDNLGNQANRIVLRHNLLLVHDLIVYNVTRNMIGWREVCPFFSCVFKRSHLVDLYFLCVIFFGLLNEYSDVDGFSKGYKMKINAVSLDNT